MSMKKSFISIFLRNYALALLAIISIGYCVGEYTKGLPGLYVLGREGIQYHSLFEIALLCFIYSFFEYLLNNIEALKTISFTKRTMVMMISCGISSVIFCYVFEWFPTENAAGWIGFFLCYFICLFTCVLVMYYKVRKEEKRYNLLLSNAQKRRNIDEHYRDEKY